MNQENQEQRIITRDDLRVIAPAAFAVGPSDNVSGRYSFISTEKLINSMAERGWAIVGGGQSRVRKPGNRIFTTHSVVFERLGRALTKVGGLVGRIIAINNHMGRKALELLSGFLRLICSNGLMVSSGVAETNNFRVHTGDTNTALDLALHSATTSLDGANSDIERWQATQLSDVDRSAFAMGALALRYPDKVGGDPRPLLVPRRDEDKGTDLWTVFNRVQENLMIGGKTVNIFNRRRKGTRRVTGISTVQRINQGLWALAQKFGAQA